MYTSLAPAKLNLFLHITSRRADGYHQLQTIFQLLDYCDVLHFQIREDGQLSCTSTAKNLLPEQDLTLKAAQLLKNYSRTSLGAHIHVEKNIPMGGGLGGGSSDAATALLTLNELWQLRLEIDVLAQLGLRLGADVPVFVHGHTAWAEGIGEMLTPLELEERWYVVVYPNCHVPTSAIFTAPELPRNMLPITLSQFIAGNSSNACEPVVYRRYPQVKVAFDWLNRYAPARLTGTGSCLFVSCAEKQRAQEIINELPKQWHGFIAQGKNASPPIKSLSFLESKS